MTARSGKLHHRNSEFCTTLSCGKAHDARLGLIHPVVTPARARQIGPRRAAEAGTLGRTGEQAAIYRREHVGIGPHARRAAMMVVQIARVGDGRVHRAEQLGENLVRAAPRRRRGRRGSSG